MATVDVIVPCYNYGRFLRECVGSVLSQEDVDVRILIIDDCSTDDSEQVGRALAAEDSRIEFRRHAKNQGHIATYNEGIDWLASEYCMLLSADDVLCPGALSRATAVMDFHPEVGLTHGRCIWTDRPATGQPLVTYWGVRIQSGAEFIQTRCEAGHNLVECPSVIGRTAIQKLVGHYQPALTHSGDMEMWLRYATHGSVASFSSHQAYYRTHGSNMSGGYNGAKDLQQIRLAFDSFFDRNPIAGAAGLRQLAYRQIAENACGVAYHSFARGDGLTSKQCLSLALELNPALRFSQKWLRLRCKQFLGPKLSRYLMRPKQLPATTA